MSQVKKLQPGGNSPKMGSITSNGVTLSGLDAINRITAVMNSVEDDEKPILGEIIRGIEKGHNFNYNVGENSIESDYELSTTARTTDSGFKRNTGALFNSKNHRARKGLQALARLDLTQKKEEVKEEKPELLGLERGSGAFEYDDKKQYINGLNNTSRMKILDDVAKYYGLDAEGRKAYDISNWKQGFDEIDTYLASLNDSDRSTYWNSLKDRIKTNKLSEADKQMLRFIGFSDSVIEESDNTGEGRVSIPKDFGASDSVVKSASDNKIGVARDKAMDNRWKITGTNDYIGKTWINSGLDFLVGTPYEEGMIIDGYLYTPEEILAGNVHNPNVLAAMKQAAGINKYTDYQTLLRNAGINYIGRDDNSYDTAFSPKQNYNHRWYSYFTGLDNADNIDDSIYNINDQTGNFSGLGDGQYVLSYYDPSKRSSIGHWNTQYVVGNSDNTFSNPVSGLKALLEANQGVTKNFASKTNTPTIENWYKATNGNEYARYLQHKAGTIFIDRNGNYHVSLKGQDGKPNGVRAVKNTDLLNRILANPEYNWSLSDFKKLSPKPNISAILTDEDKLRYLRSLRSAGSSDIVRKEGGTIPKAKFGIKLPGGISGQELKPNWSNIDDFIRLGVSNWAVDKNTRLQKKALNNLYNRQFQTPQLTRVRYDDSDIQQGYSQAARPILENKFVTSDGHSALAFNLAKGQQLSQLEGQKNAAITQRIGQVNEQNRQIDAVNTQARVQTANEKSAYLANLGYQNDMLDSVGFQNKMHNINTFGQQMSQMNRNWNNKLAELNYNAGLTALQDEYSRGLEAKASEIYQRYYASQAYKAGKSFDEYLRITPTDYNLYNEIAKEYRKEFNYPKRQIQTYKEYMGGLKGSMWLKKGGTTPKFRPAQEQIAIDLNKASRKSIDELSKSLMRMLQQLMK